MIHRCPHCGHLLDADDHQTTVEDLRRTCRENGWGFPADRVSEQTAARLLDRSPGTLRNWRSFGSRPLPYSRPGSGRGRITYRLADVAEFMDRQDNE
jgi:hypothetical protein